MARTRCSSSPALAASWRWSRWCSAHRSLTLLLASMSGTPAELRAVTVHVLHLGDVAPGNLPDVDAQGLGQPPPLLRAGRVAALDDRLDDLAVQARRVHQVL